MKKYLFLLIFILLFICGCGSNYVNKTEFYLNEKANIDKLDVTLKKVIYTDSNNLVLTFEIKNNRKDTLVIDADEYFKFYDSNGVVVLNNYTDNASFIKKNESISYTVSYNIDRKELYEIYFYSGIVENNIKFNIISQNISNN